MPRPLPPIVARLEEFGFRFPVRLIRSLPFDSAFRLGERLGAAAYHLARPQRRAALVNLGIAFPEKSDADRLAILREACRNFGRMAVEFCHMNRLTEANIAETVTFADPGFWNANKHIIGTTGILILTGHFGNWELLHYAMGLYGCPIHLIHRPFRNPRFDRFVNAERCRTGTRLISKRAAAREVVRVLRERGIVAIPFDQNATGRWGVFADFFGVPASTHPGLARLAELSGAPVYPVFLVRENGSARHRIHIGDRVEVAASGDRDRDTAENLSRFNAVFAAMVRRHPDHWIWMHKRWRTRPPGAPPIY
jgi:KDO2-lipid IV(A) lauroyltransferase